MLDIGKKRRVRFTQLDEEAKQRLRTLYHLTSAQAALSIARTGYLWSNDPDGCANFSLNRDLKLHYTTTPEVALTFKFHGEVHLREREVDFAGYAPNTLNLHLKSWPTLYGLEGLRVAIARVAAGTTMHLECVDFKLTPEFIWKCRSDPNAELLLRRLRRQLALGRTVKVPGTPQERQAIEAQTLEEKPDPSWVQKVLARLTSGATV
ncbi:MAG: hypothetical protein KGN32_00940 [Burkholderiales bacterium]|nr:hypothetical protein [Burkholderiales bacterium]